MATDPAVLAAIRSAVEAQPANVALRLHLAGLLVDGGSAAEAVEHCATALASEPDNVDALRLAARAATAAGDGGRAARFQRLADALGQALGPPPVG